MTGARLIGLDWGSSALRAYLIASDGTVLAQRGNDSGASRLVGDAAGFEAALRGLIGDWLREHAGLPLVACGMVGSTHGWLEAPYALCPVALDSLHALTVIVHGQEGLRVHIVPGVAQRPAGGVPDVMRGEETQVAGLLVQQPGLAEQALLVLPGTHSKWVSVRGGRIESFATRMTGELFALLRSHSVLGRLIEPTDEFCGEAFDQGVHLGKQDQGADLMGRLFSVRTLGLFEELPRTALADYLSGLLIGSEIAAALVPGMAEGPLALVGEAALCDRYRRALQAFGREALCVPGNTAATGLWQVAEHAGW
ncbi:2-dehydro-3-deoxygalactonokinase [Aquabacterium sp.]|uniref:2-dehydro-3-deoxygalactonokinase n=1 Tax=Aquabacterium sp. TaxID=1872578 RepID=UPI002C3A5167|nr:2-dehydro-3-deoxygalactonokinase [Aquabacterium sp.]HSW08417.1 2-dehydro-3-deoxygalactonokinase [Aquabacterium sp.]